MHIPKAGRKTRKGGTGKKGARNREIERGSSVEGTEGGAGIGREKGQKRKARRSVHWRRNSKKEERYGD